MDTVEHALAAIAKGTAADSLEGLSLEFKTAAVPAEVAFADLADAAVCFANASGGQIVVGVKDRPGGADAFVGCEHPPELLRQRIHELTEPHLTVESRVVLREGVTLVVLQVPEGLDVYSTTKGATYRRFGDQCRPMRPAEIVTVAEERRGQDRTARVTSRDPRDAEPRALELLREFVASSARPGAERPARLDDRSLLEEWGLLARGRLTTAAEILLCRGADGVASEAIVYQHRRTPAGEADAVERWGTPFLVAYDEVMTALRFRQGITPVTLGSGVQMQVEDFPVAVVREALVNALVHGDHRYREPIRIVHSPESMSVVSPGPLVSGITRQTILTRGRARFPLLASTFRRLGLAEELGQGVDRMFRDMIKSGRSVPEILDEADSVHVTLAGGPPNRRITQFVQDLPPDEREDTDALLVVVMLCDRRTINARDVAPVVQRSADEAQRLLHRLATGPAQLVEPTPGTLTRRQPNYRLRHEAVTRLGPAVSYRRRSRSELDTKVVAHLAEYEYINNSTLQRLVDVDVFQARDLLQDLVGREILVRISKQTRGRAVRYGPGPSFPSTKKR